MDNFDIYRWKQNENQSSKNIPDFDLYEWNKNRYLNEGINDREINGRLSDIKYDFLTSYFNGEIFHTPNPDDSSTRINDEGDWVDWKQDTLDRYGNVDLKLDNTAVWYDKIKVLDNKFQSDKEDYTKGKAAALNKIRQRTNFGLDESKEDLKEYTDDRFKGAELIDDVSSRSPDMFGKQLFSDILPMGVASEDDAVKALQAHDKSGIKQRMGIYAPMFVHVQYHEFEHEGEKYRLHQSQYYNNNFADKDPDFNPRVSKLTLLKITKSAEDRFDREESETLGTILAKTDDYVKDLDKLDISKRAMEESKMSKGKGNEIKETIKFIKENNPKFTVEEIINELKEIKELGKQLNEKLCKKGEAYRKRRMAAGEKSSAYLSGRAVKVCKGQMSGKSKKKK